MLNFLYFVPQLLRQDVTRERVTTAGLGDVFRDRLSQDDIANKGRLAIADVMHGPGGHTGTILYPLPTVPAEDEADGIGYYQDRQQWLHVPVAGTPGYWLGWDPANLPTPEALQRDFIVSGYTETLADGRQWECPIIRRAQGAMNLPDVWGLVDGKVVSRVKPAWQWAWDLSGEIWDQYVNGESASREVAYAWCAKLLSINYRVGLQELTVMNVLGSDEASEILRNAIAGPLIEKMREEQKKTSTPGTGGVSNSLPGSEVSPPVTAPAAATST